MKRNIFFSIILVNANKLNIGGLMCQGSEFIKLKHPCSGEPNIDERL
jgi:hypothetical protein